MHLLMSLDHCTRLKQWNNSRNIAHNQPLTSIGDFNFDLSQRRTTINASVNSLLSSSLVTLKSRQPSTNEIFFFFLKKKKKKKKKELNLKFERIQSNNAKPAAISTSSTAGVGPRAGLEYLPRVEHAARGPDEKVDSIEDHQLEGS